MSLKKEDSFQHQILEIYAEALTKIDPFYFSDPFNINAEKLRVNLLQYANTTRQTREARIARSALREVAYLNIANESK